MVDIVRSTARLYHNSFQSDVIKTKSLVLITAPGPREDSFKKKTTSEPLLSKGGIFPLTQLWIPLYPDPPQPLGEQVRFGRFQYSPVVGSILGAWKHPLVLFFSVLAGISSQWSC